MAARANRIAALTDALRRSEMPPTVSELAEAVRLAPSTAYAAMKAMEKQGIAEKAGIALNGGQCWRLTGEAAGS